MNAENRDKAADAAAVFARRTVHEQQKLDHRDGPGAGDLDFFAFRLIREPMDPNWPQSVKVGYLLTIVRTALAMLVAESGRRFAAFIAADVVFPPGKVLRALTTWSVLFLLIGGVIQTVETWPPLLVKFLDMVRP